MHWRPYGSIDVLKYILQIQSYLQEEVNNIVTILQP